MPASCCEAIPSEESRNNNDIASFTHLIANDKRLQVFTDTVPVGILILRIEDGTVLYSNRAFNDIFGADGSAVMGSSWESYFLHPEDRQRLMVKFVEEEKVRNMELQLLRADGSIMWAQLSLSNIPIEDEDLLLFSFVDITPLKEAEEKIRQLADHDALTQLPNMRLFRHQISKAISRSKRGKYKTAVIFVDLDDFKRVNDSLGHNAGDSVLIEVAKRLLMCVRETDTVARIGGDEFVIVLEDLEPTDAHRISQRMVSDLSQPIFLEEGMAIVGASIGVAFYPQNGDNPDVLIRAADTAMYEIKKKSKGSYAFAQIRHCVPVE